MKPFAFILFLSFYSIAWVSKNGANNWIKKTGSSFDMNFTEADKPFMDEYEKIIDTGIQQVVFFFGENYKTKFDVFVHPNRNSLDSCWEKDWKMPGFRSECWMVASGISTRIDMISPHAWNEQSCEHTYADKEKMQQLITHELVHVFHGQQNSSGDFSKVENIDWFVEGLAAFASGQVDLFAVKKVKKAIAEKQIPLSLDKFWSGSLRYAVSGSVVLYIDKKYGRTFLKTLLPCTNKEQILILLQTSEEQLLNGWTKFINSFPS